MTIYTFDKVTELLTQLNLESYYHVHREHYFKKLHPELHQEVYDTTAFLGTAKFIERLYCFTNGITERPKCKVCGKEVSFSQYRVYHTYCYKTCALLDQPALHGVENMSQLQSVKDKKLETMRNNHGVDNPSELQSVKDKISVKAKERWDNELNSLVEDLGFEPMNCTRKQYYKLVWRITEYMYRIHQSIIDPDKSRSKNMHIDHMVSIRYGFSNNISPVIIGDITNLRMLLRSENSRKSYRNSISINELLDNYNLFYQDSRKPFIDDDMLSLTNCDNNQKLTKSRYTTKTGICKHCGGDANYIRIDNSYQCKPKVKECPAKLKDYAHKRKLRKKAKSAERKVLQAAGLIKRKKRATDTVETRLKKSQNAKGKRWFNNGTDVKFSFECPDGYVEGRGKQFFNNSEIQVFEFNCPLGFVSGRLPKPA